VLEWGGRKQRTRMKRGLDGGQWVDTESEDVSDSKKQLLFASTAASLTSSCASLNDLNFIKQML
jgi:hypothetical protein